MNVLDIIFDEKICSLTYIHDITHLFRREEKNDNELTDITDSRDIFAGEKLKKDAEMIKMKDLGMGNLKFISELVNYPHTHMKRICNLVMQSFNETSSAEYKSACDSLINLWQHFSNIQLI